jgi:hypothetical protein
MIAWQQNEQERSDCFKKINPPSLRYNFVSAEQERSDCRNQTNPGPEIIILVDYARSRNYAKRGGGARELSLDEGLIVSEERSAEVVAVHEALEELAKIDPRKTQIVELKFFGGLSIDERAQVLAVLPLKQGRNAVAQDQSADGDPRFDELLKLVRR